MLSFLGIGGAGGNIAHMANELGFHAGVINFSQKDLDSVQVPLKLKLLGSEGVGHNRDEAIRLMENNWENAVQFVQENFNSPSIKVIAVCFSTGGGSGSGISPMLIDLISNTVDKTVIALPIIPDKSEVVINQLNCINTFEEISNLDVAYFPIDNEKVKSQYLSIGKDKLYNEVNSHVVQLFANLIDYTDKNSMNGNIDERDLLTIFNTKGMGTIGYTSVSDLGKGAETVQLNEETLSKTVQQSWSKGVFTNIEKEQIFRAGFIYDGDNAYTHHINFASIFNYFNNDMPVDLFEGFYNEGNDEIYTILSGLSVCSTRLNQIKELIENKQESINKMASESSNKKYDSGLSSFDLKIRNKPKRTSNVTDILNKYKR